MEIEDIKSPEDILEFFEKNIRYGWLDCNMKEHIMTKKEVSQPLLLYWILYNFQFT